MILLVIGDCFASHSGDDDDNGTNDNSDDDNGDGDEYDKIRKGIVYDPVKVSWAFCE